MMLLHNVFTKSLRENHRAIFVWAIATAAVAAMYASFYPQIAGGSMSDLVAKFPPAVKDTFALNDLSSAAGYLQSTTFGLLVPLLMIIYGIATGSGAIAGDEEAGLLDALLAHPVGRSQLLLQRAAAMATGAATIATAVFLAMLAIRTTAQLSTISVIGFAAQALNAAMLATLFSALALAVGAVTGSRSVALGLSALIGVLSYAANTIVPQTGAGWARLLSPFHYYIGAQPLKYGVTWQDTAILLGTTVALIGLATAAFSARDLRS